MVLNSLKVGKYTFPKLSKLVDIGVRLLKEICMIYKSPLSTVNLGDEQHQR